MEHGPVDVVIIALGEPKFDGSVLEELQRLASEGIVRVLDAMIIVKDEDGNALGLDIEDLPADQSSALGFIETGTRGLFDSEDSAMLIEGMVPGSAVVALAIENVWAVGLRRKMEESGGEIAMTLRIPGPMIDDALAELGVE
jgi:hypothetical protein